MAPSRARPPPPAGNNIVLCALCLLLGLIGGFTFGHVHGLHGCAAAEAPLASRLRAAAAPCDGPLACGGVLREANETRRALDAAMARLGAVEAKAEAAEARHSLKAGGCPPCEGSAEEQIAHAEELEAEIADLHAAAARAQEGGASTMSLQSTQWKTARAFDRKELWDRTLTGFPYVMGATLSRGGLLFTKKNNNGSLDGALKTCKEVDVADTLPKMYSIKEALATTAAFAGNVPGLLQKVRGLIKSRKIAARHDSVVVMATNLGTLDLVANFVCSVASVPELEPTLASVLVFASDGGTRDAVEKLGIAAFSDPALGDLPSDAAKVYGDRSFVRMMWLKVTSVYLVLSLQHNVLFQDADVVWFRDPLPYFAEIADDQVDTFWMDDGARSSRYTPWYANSGFYFLRANERVVFFMHRLLMSYDVILAVRSHQHALIMLLTDLMAKHGLTAQLLPNTDFPQGQVFHHKKEIMKDFVAGRRKPYVFHMCWTASRVDKLRYLKNIALWFLDPSCPEDSWANASRLDGHHDRSCCLAGAKAWTVPTPYANEIKLASK
ncbi:nucleotide-diphospho-sugar transferase [Aureococcus anophagefferens]|nr:nucleotide-diphospho-sugar transferase [Aureococcus anophagefferens]